jgi:4-amino-4-deoxy-L-arabinose transferase-like glycosyltransferase
VKAAFWRRVAALLVLEVLAVALYARGLRYGPIWDDHTFVEAQPFLAQPSNLLSVLDPRHLFHVLPVRGSARPVWLASVLADRALLGASFTAHRLLSALWHAWAAGAVMVLCAALGGAPPAAVAAGLLFLFHPVHAEAVQIVTFRTDILALFFMALSLALYAAGRERKARARRAFHAGSLALLAAALLSKEMAVVAPALALAVDFYFPARGWRGRPRWLMLSAMLALVVAYLGFRGPRSGYALGGRGDALTRLLESRPELFEPFSAEPLPTDAGSLKPARPSLQSPPWLDEYYARPAARLRGSLQVLLEDARLLFWPARLSGIYDPRPAEGWLDARVLGGLAAAALAAWGAWALRRRAPLAAFGLAWTLICLAPVSGAVELRNLVAERYLVVPSAGLALAAGALFAAAWKRRKRRWAAAAALAALCAAGAARVQARLPDFAGDAAFHRASVRADPSSPRAHAALARALFFEGRPEESRAEYRAALALWPGFRRAGRELAALDAPALAAARPKNARR